MGKLMGKRAGEISPYSLGQLASVMASHMSIPSRPREEASPPASVSRVGNQSVMWKTL